MKCTKFLTTIACRLERRLERGRLTRDEAYLAQASDHADLERRQRDLGRPHALIPHYG